MSGLYVAEPGGAFRPASDGAIIRAAAGAVGRAMNRGPIFNSPKIARRWLPALLGAREYEVFCIAHLDNRHRLIKFEELFRGTVDGAAVPPRELLRAIIACNSAAVILVHNHPSGVAEPSAADELITKRIREVLAMIDVKVVDHLIVAGDAVLSFAERGLL